MRKPVITSVAQLWRDAEKYSWELYESPFDLKGFKERAGHFELNGFYVRTVTVKRQDSLRLGTSWLNRPKADEVTFQCYTPGGSICDGSGVFSDNVIVTIKNNMGVYRYHLRPVAASIVAAQIAKQIQASKDAEAQAQEKARIEAEKDAQKQAERLDDAIKRAVTGERVTGPEAVQVIESLELALPLRTKGWAVNSLVWFDDKRMELKNSKEASHAFFRVWYEALRRLNGERKAV